MRVIANSTLVRFCRSSPHHRAKTAIEAWYRVVSCADWASPEDVKASFRHASILRDGRVVFNVAGNRYRIVVWINYGCRVVYIRFVGTHAEHDRIDANKV